MKTWKQWPGFSCPDCGSSTEVQSDADAKVGWINDGDLLRCSDPLCPRHTKELGQTTVYDVDDVSASFEPWPVDDSGCPYDPKDY